MRFQRYLRNEILRSFCHPNYSKDILKDILKVLAELKEKSKVDQIY